MAEFANPFEAHRNVGIPMQEKTWQDHQFSDEDWAGMTMMGCVFERVAFLSINLLQTMFVECRFVDCTFEDCQIVGTNLTACTGTGFRIRDGACRELMLSDCTLDEVRFEQSGQQLVLAGCRIGDVRFADAGLSQEIPTISDCEIGNLHAANAMWSDASAAGADLSLWDIAGASFRRCSFIRAAAEGVDLTKVEFVSCNLFQSRLRGARFRAVEECIFSECNLDDADFQDARAAGSLYSKSQARGCRFDAASIEGALFPETDLTAASFTAANAPNSVWVDANLTDANLERLSARLGTFRNACLQGASLLGCDMREADLHGVQGDLRAADTRDARGSVEWRAERESDLRQFRADPKGR
ncbi:MAG: hypothetical protein F4Y86_16540 [Gammaproteobacteria bacterium]|nr:hypothetical protein [Gammaproteobacteria bacterium]MYB36741.1 hypothetical protein [Gammaproteobacteria bacterium]